MKIITVSNLLTTRTSLIDSPLKLSSSKSDSSFEPNDWTPGFELKWKIK